MSPFPVWLRPLGGDCRVRVEGMKNAQWLLARLSQAFVFKTSESIQEDREPPCRCTFRVAYSSQVPRRALERLLASIPEVRVMLEPA